MYFIVVALAVFALKSDFQTEVPFWWMEFILGS